MPGGTLGSARRFAHFAYGGLTRCARPFHASSAMPATPSERPATPPAVACGLGPSLFARRYLGNRCFLLFLRVLRCFSSPGCLLRTYFVQCGMPAHCRGRVPSFGHLRLVTAVCALPQLIAACHVLLRLLVPRHPPRALFHLTNQARRPRWAALCLLSVN